MLLGHLCFFLFFFFFCPASCPYPLFYFCCHALLLALLYMFLLLVVGCWGWMRKGAAFAGFLNLIRERRKLYMFFVMLSLGFFERLIWLLWGVIGGLNPLRSVGKEGTFCIFGLGKGSVYGVLDGWNNGTFCIRYITFFFSFLSHLFVLNCA